MYIDIGICSLFPKTGSAISKLAADKTVEESKNYQSDTIIKADAYVVAL